MSTILDALKKVERERQSPRGQLLNVPDREPRGPRRLSVGLIAACATLGLAAGVGLALWRDTVPVEIAALLPNLPPLPAIDIPTIPVPDHPGEDAAASAMVPAEAAQQPEQLALAVPQAAAPPAEIPPKETLPPAPKGESALEPSPFAPPRTTNLEQAAPPESGRAPSAEPPVAVPQSPPDTVAALAPAAPAVAPAALPPESDVPPPQAEEPPPLPEPVIDTGRSPPGAPRVALTFLQWSTDPTRRFAFVSIDGAPAQRVREGDTTGSLTVAEITPRGVQFKQDGKIFVIRPRH